MKTVTCKPAQPTDYWEMLQIIASLAGHHNLPTNLIDTLKNKPDYVLTATIANIRIVLNELEKVN